MLLNSVIIVLREVLEAVLLISLLLNVSNVLKLSKRWFTYGVGLGFIGAAAYAWQHDVVSDLFDGVGQEMVGGASLSLVYLCLLLIAPALLNTTKTRFLGFASWAAIGLLLCLEGAEVVVYLSSAIAQPEKQNIVLAGAIIGLGIGASMGVFFYQSVAALPAAIAHRALLLLLALVAAGMALQASQFFIQADYLPSARAIWNSSAWLPEDSVSGQLLYALLGYEASPSLLQVVIYLISLTLMLIVPLAFRRRG